MSLIIEYGVWYDGMLIYEGPIYDDQRVPFVAGVKFLRLSDRLLIKGTAAAGAGKVILRQISGISDAFAMQGSGDAAGSVVHNIDAAIQDDIHELVGAGEGHGTVVHLCPLSQNEELLFRSAAEAHGRILRYRSLSDKEQFFFRSTGVSAAAIVHLHSFGDHSAFLFYADGRAHGSVVHEIQLELEEDSATFFTETEAHLGRALLCDVPALSDEIRISAGIETHAICIPNFWMPKLEDVESIQCVAEAHAERILWDQPYLDNEGFLVIRQAVSAQLQDGFLDVF